MRVVRVLAGEHWCEGTAGAESHACHSMRSQSYRVAQGGGWQRVWQASSGVSKGSGSRTGKQEARRGTRGLGQHLVVESFGDEEDSSGALQSALGLTIHVLSS